MDDDVEPKYFTKRRTYFENRSYFAYNVLFQASKEQFLK